MKGWLDRLRGRKPALIPEALWSATLARFAFLDHLTVDEKNRLKLQTEAFLAEKEFSAAGRLQLTDEICVAIAAQGCLPILNLGLSAYSDWVGIVVYPNEFVVPRSLADDDGVVHEYDDVLSGEAWEGGPLIVSWHDVTLAGDGYNVVIHEFAHKLDMLNGEADGIPALHSGLDEAAWDAVFMAAYDNFCQRIDRDEDTVIDPYASESPAEFFAVISECFFEMPDTIAGDYPALYDLFSRYYRQDPLTRLANATNAAKTAAS